MKILSIFGSPRRNGNTATILKRVEQGIGKYHEIEHVNIIDLKINGCLGCDNCQKSEILPSCIHKDDMIAVLDKIIDADLIIYSSPVYVWDFTAQMKLLIDRQYALVKWKYYGEKSLVEGKKAILITTCGGDTSSNTDLITEVFNRECNYLKQKVLGLFVVGNCTVPKELGKEADVVVLSAINTVMEQK